MSNERKDKAAIENLLERYRDGFHRLDFRQLCSLWDKDHGELVYVAQELPAALRGWPAIEKYYAGTTDSPEPMIGMSLDSISIQVFGDTAIAFFNFMAHAEIDLELPGRVSMIARRREDGWKVIHYHESAVAAAVERVAQATG